MLKITRKGYNKVYKDGVFISQHSSDWEPIESIARSGEGTYRVVFAEVEVVNDDGNDYSPYQTDGSGTQTEVFNQEIRVTVI